MTPGWGIKGPFAGPSIARESAHLHYASIQLFSDLAV